MVQIHIHEDDWGMRNLYPVAAFEEAARDVEHAIAAGIENRAPDGVGWNNVHIISEPKASWRSLNVTVPEMRAVLAPLLPTVTRFKAGSFGSLISGEVDAYGSCEDNPVAYGFDSRRFIKVDTTDGMVSAVWFECGFDGDIDDGPILQALEAIHQCWPCCIADYWLDAAIDMSTDAALERYQALGRQ